MGRKASRLDEPLSYYKFLGCEGRRAAVYGVDTYQLVEVVGGRFLQPKALEICRQSACYAVYFCTALVQVKPAVNVRRID